MSTLVRVTATAVLAFSLSGCGLNKIESGRYQLKMVLSSVVHQYNERYEHIQSVVKTLKSANAIQSDLAQEWEAAHRAAQSLAGVTINDQGNAAVRSLDSSWRLADQVVAKVLMQADVAMNNSKVLLTKAERDNVRTWTLRYNESDAPVAKARAHYTLEVQTHNQVLSTFPVSLAAKLLGEEQRIGLSDAPSMVKESAGTLIDAATRTK